MNEPVENAELPEKSNILLGGVILGLYWVTFLWGFWIIGIYALGFNATCLLLGLAALAYVSDSRTAEVLRDGRKWTIPLVLIAVSYSLFENPFIKIINCLVIPILCGVFFRYGIASREKEFVWTPKFVAVSIAASLFVPQFWALGLIEYVQALRNRCSFKVSNPVLVGRIAKGIVILVALSAFVVVPLLSSADMAFSNKVTWIFDGIYRWVISLFEMTFIAKTCFAAVVACFAVGIVKLCRHMDSMKSVNEVSPTDSVVSGIVVGGVLFLYGLFIWVQIEQLWFSSLPTQFTNTEKLVKGGFWQLVVISFINILLFTWCYRRTNSSVQFILSLFTPACLVLVLSAANRMWLYVTTYGFSYEKFYAFYTVIFCLIVFVFLLVALVAAERKDVVKFACFLFLWMYGLVTVFPVERFVLKANLALSETPGSRVSLDEMTMLSSDVLDIVHSERLYLSDSGRRTSSTRWSTWYKNQGERLVFKQWYEYNLSNIVNHRRLFVENPS